MIENRFDKKGFLIIPDPKAVHEEEQKKKIDRLS